MYTNNFTTILACFGIFLSQAMTDARALDVKNEMDNKADIYITIETADPYHSKELLKEKKTAEKGSSANFTIDPLKIEEMKKYINKNVPINISLQAYEPGGENARRMYARCFNVYVATTLNDIEKLPHLKFKIAGFGMCSKE